MLHFLSLKITTVVIQSSTTHWYNKSLLFYNTASLAHNEAIIAIFCKTKNHDL